MRLTSNLPTLEKQNKQTNKQTNKKKKNKEQESVVYDCLGGNKNVKIYLFPFHTKYLQHTGLLNRSRGAIIKPILSNSISARTIHSTQLEKDSERRQLWDVDFFILSYFGQKITYLADY